MQDRCDQFEHRKLCSSLPLTPEILTRSQYRNNPVEQHDSISTLPSELQCLIWFMLDNQADRLMLALTCKWHAAMYESVKDKPFQSTSRKISPKSKIKAMPGRRRAPAKKRLTDKDRLEMLWRLQEWEPLSTKSRYKLCYKCICFLPRGYTFYPERTSPFGWGGRAMDLNAISAAEARIVGYRCPECCAFTAGQLVSETKEYKEAERKTRKVLETKW